MDLHVLRGTESKKVIFSMSGSVCVCLWTLTQKIIELAHLNLVWFYMIKISAGIAYEQNRPTGVASALIALFWGAKSALKMHCTIFYYQTKVVTNYNTQLLVQKPFWPPHGCGLCPDSTISFFFLAKSALKMRFTKFYYQTKVVTNQNPQLMLCNIFRYLAPLWSYSGFSYVVCQESIVPSYGTEIFVPSISTLRSIEKFKHLGISILIPLTPPPPPKKKKKKSKHMDQKDKMYIWHSMEIENLYVSLFSNSSNLFFFWIPILDAKWSVRAHWIKMQK